MGCAHPWRVTVNARAFWSYAHRDDEAENGRIAGLARDVVAQYEMITGEMIELFLDTDSLEWGDEWRPKVDASLSSVAFFIPVLTPRYFQSVECRRELNFFARQATRLGVRELVMPILYVDVPACTMTLLLTRQWRLSSPSSGSRGRSFASPRPHHPSIELRYRNWRLALLRPVQRSSGLISLRRQLPY